MDANNSMPTQGSPNMATNSWWSQQTKKLRREMACHIINVLKQQCPFDDPNQIENIALSFEENIFTADTSLEDYMQQISRKLRPIDDADKDNALQSLPSNPPNAVKNPGDQGSRYPQGQLCKPEQPFQNPMQQQAVQTMPASFTTHGRQPQLEPDVHKFISQSQSPPADFMEVPHPIHEELKEAFPMLHSLFEAQKLRMQLRQLLQSKNTFPPQAANLKFEEGQVDEDTWQEEIYQRLQTLKKLFLPEMKGSIYQLDASLQQMDSAPRAKKTAEFVEVFLKQFDMHNYLMKLEWLLDTPRHEIEPRHKQDFAKLEKDLMDFFKSEELKRFMSSQFPKQLPLPNMNAFQQSTNPHNQNPYQSDTNMLQRIQLKQQGIAKSHLGEQPHPQVKVKQEGEREMKIMQQQQPLKLHALQMSGSHTNINEVMITKQEMGNTRTPMQQHFFRQLQVKLEPPSSVSYPQLLQVAFTHPCQNPSPKKKQKNLQTSPEKTGTSAGLPQESGAGLATSSSIRIPIPGLSASPLLESSNDRDNNPGNVSEHNPQVSSVIEQPLQRLLRVVNSMSPETLGASVGALESVVGTVEKIAKSVPDKASKPVVGEDLVAMTRYHLQDIYSPLAFLISGWTSDSRISEIESTATFPESTMIKVNNSLMEEIGMINRRLINTVVEISEDNDNSSTVASFTEDSQAKIVKCVFIPPATTQNFISSHASENLLPIQPLSLLIPGTYPSHSPLVLDKPSALARHGDASTSNEDLWVKAITIFELHLQSVEQPFSLLEIAKAWDACASSVVCEYAEQYGGGTFSSRYGVWENCEMQW